MNRTIVIGGSVIVVAIAAWWGYTAWGDQQAQFAAEQAAQAQPVEDLTNVIWASGTLEPVTWAGLSTATTGIVSRIHVTEGDIVQAGDVLLDLDNGVLQSEVEVAVAEVTEAQAALDKLLAGATGAEIASAEARVSAADAQVALAAGLMLEAQAAIDSAEAAVAIAEREYAEMASHPTAAERTVAAADVAVAESAVSQTQAAYNLVRGDPQIVARPESLALQQATTALEAAKARAALTDLGPTSQQLAVAQSRVDAARVAVRAAASRGPGAEAAVQAAIADQASAQASLDQLRAGATGEAHVTAAEAALTSARARLAQSQVIAPFAGQVGSLVVRLGEMATPEQFLVLLGDTRAMHVKTTDLRETDVVRLEVGMPVEVTFDALPDRIFSGEITRIAPVSNTEKGSTNYTVEVDVADLDPGLRWGMTAFVNIEATR